MMQTPYGVGALISCRSGIEPARGSRSQDPGAVEHTLEIDVLDGGVCAGSSGSEDDRRDPGSAEDRRIEPATGAQINGLTLLEFAEALRKLRGRGRGRESPCDAHHLLNFNQCPHNKRHRIVALFASFVPRTFSHS